MSDRNEQFIQACRNGEIATVKLLLDNNEIDINYTDDDNATGLIHACEQNHFDIVKLLIENKADVNIKKINRRLVRPVQHVSMETLNAPKTVLSISLLSNYIEIAEYIINYKINNNIKFTKAEREIILTCFNGTCKHIRTNYRDKLKEL